MHDSSLKTCQSSAYFPQVYEVAVTRYFCIKFFLAFEGIKDIGKDGLLIFFFDIVLIFFRFPVAFYKVGSNTSLCQVSIT